MADSHEQADELDIILEKYELPPWGEQYLDEFEGDVVAYAESLGWSNDDFDIDPLWRPESHWLPGWQERTLAWGKEVVAAGQGFNSTGVRAANMICTAWEVEIGAPLTDKPIKDPEFVTEAMTELYLRRDKEVRQELAFMLWLWKKVGPKTRADKKRYRRACNRLKNELLALKRNLERLVSLA